MNISFEDFKKIDLRVARILEVERIEDSEKLFKIKIDVGGEERILVSGVSNYYEPKDLIQKQVIVILNLEPKIIFGVESHGMILFARDKEKPIVLSPEEEVADGAIIS